MKNKHTEMAHFTPSHSEAARQSAGFGHNATEHITPVIGSAPCHAPSLITDSQPSGDMPAYVQELESRIKTLRAENKALVTKDRQKNDFLATLSHELRTPLNVVIGYSESMTQQLFGTLNQNTLNHSETILDAGLHMQALINDLLDIARLDTGSLELVEEEISIREVFTSSLRLTRTQADEARVLVLERIQPPYPQLLADRHRVQQILINLVSNAIKSTPQDGQVVLTAAVNNNEEIFFRISDTGVGMTVAELKSALRSGLTSAELATHTQGLGLGLPLSKSLVEVHGGRFDIESRKGTGTTITVTFPVSRTISGTNFGQSIQSI